MATGALFCREFPPEALPDYARAVERLGYDELWVVEDCFWTGAVSAAAVAAAVTDRLVIGIGIIPAAFRNAAATAMELALLGRLFPGRLLAGFGHGVPAWVRQVGAHHPSPLAVLGETMGAVRTLLHGGTVDVTGRAVSLADVRLEFPPAIPPPVYAGVRNEKSLRLAGRVADGTILAEGSSPAYLRWATDRIAEGRAEAGRRDAHRLVVYADLDLDPDRAHARAVLAARLSGPAALGPADRDLAGELAGLLARAPDPAALAAALPEAWVDRFTVAGTPRQVADGLLGLRAAGADSVVLVPPRDLETALDQLRRVAPEPH